jgi:hypothetical protein
LAVGAALSLASRVSAAGFAAAETSAVALGRACPSDNMRECSVRFDLSNGDIIRRSLPETYASKTFHHARCDVT